MAYYHTKNAYNKVNGIAKSNTKYNKYAMAYGEAIIDYSTNQLEEEYLEMIEIGEILKDPKKMFCPFCDSYALIPNYENFKLDPNDSKYKKSTMTCTKGHQFCSCGIALHEGDCYRDTNDFQKFLIE